MAVAPHLAATRTTSHRHQFKLRPSSGSQSYCSVARGSVKSKVPNRCSKACRTWPASPPSKGMIVVLIKRSPPLASAPTIESLLAVALASRTGKETSQSVCELLAEQRNALTCYWTTAYCVNPPTNHDAYQNVLHERTVPSASLSPD